MRHRWTLRRFFLTLPVLLFAGCGGEGGAEKGEIELPDWLTEDSRSASPKSNAIFDQLDRAKLTLNLKPGDRFPLRKVVEQELTQNSPTGFPLINRSRLEVMFAITVADRQEDRTKLDVRYDRVKYSHDIAEERVEYDSSNPGGEIPVAVRAYHDMVEDGFAFWLGRDNQIVEVEGFKEFLKRCLRNVPAERRQEVMLGIEAGSGESGIANFVDNSIGLLPFGGSHSPGDSWERPLHIGRPVPMHINNVYTLKELTNDHAVIDIRGTVAPSTTRNAYEEDGDIRINVTGGNTTGSCTIFRDTGLPKESRVDRTLIMTVSMSNAVEFKQRKRTTTTIESFPVSAGASPTMIGFGGGAGEFPGDEPGGSQPQPPFGGPSLR